MTIDKQKYIMSVKEFEEYIKSVPAYFGYKEAWNDYKSGASQSHHFAFYHHIDNKPIFIQNEITNKMETEGLIIEVKLHNLPEGKRWVALAQTYYSDGRKHDMPCAIGMTKNEAVERLLEILHE